MADPAERRLVIRPADDLHATGQSVDETTGHDSAGWPVTLKAMVRIGVQRAALPGNRKTALRWCSV